MEKYKHLPYFIGFFVVLLVIILYSSISAPIEIIFIERVDYNVTYNSTDLTEYPPDDEPVDDLLNRRILTVTGKLTIFNNAQEKISDINITLNQTANLTEIPVLSPDSDVNAYVHNITWTPENGGEIVLHIPDLPVGKRAIFEYKINVTEVSEPVDIDEVVYTGMENGRVFNNEMFNVSIKVSIPDYYPKDDLEIKLNVTQIAMNNFTFHNDTAESKAFNNVSEGYIATNYSTTNDTIVWADVVLYGKGATAYAYFNHTVLSPNTTTLINPAGYNENKNWVAMEFARLELNLTTNDTLSSLNIKEITAVSISDVRVIKRRASAWNWSAIPYFRNPTQDLYYRLKRFTVWSTISNRNFDTGVNGLPDPGQDIMVNSSFEWNASSGELPVDLGYGAIWNADEKINYTFVNKTHVPIIWGNAEFTIVNNASVINETRYTKNRTVGGMGSYVYFQKIIFLYGYFLQATKKIRGLSEEGVYEITINITNRGNGITPNSTLLADLVPAGFNLTFEAGGLSYSEENMTINSSAGKDYQLQGVKEGILWSRFGGIYNFTGKSKASGEFENDTVYFWELTPLEPGESVQIRYYVNGSGEFRSSFLYIIGVDPVQTQRFGAVRRLVTVDGLSNMGDNPENIFIPISFAIFIFSAYTTRKK